MSGSSSAVPEIHALKRRQRISGRGAWAERLEPRELLSASASLSGLTFSSPITTPIAPGAVTAVAGDFNNDGLLDLAIVNETGIGVSGVGAADVSVSVLEGQGNGKFSAPVTTRLNLEASANPAGLPAGNAVVLGQAAVAAFDGNDSILLAVRAGDSSGETVLLLPGNGNGTFAAPVSLFSDVGASSVSPTGNATGFTILPIRGAGTEVAAGGLGVVTVGGATETAVVPGGVFFIPSQTAGDGYVIAAPGEGIPGSGTTGLGSAGSGNVFAGPTSAASPIETDAFAYGDANGLVVATGTTGGTGLGVALGFGASPIVTTPAGALGLLTANEGSLGAGSLGSLGGTIGVLPTFNQVSNVAPLSGAFPTFGASGLTSAGTIAPLSAVGSTSAGQTVLLQTLGVGTTQTLVGVPGFPSALPVGLATGRAPFVVTGDFNDDGAPDLAVINPQADTVQVLLNTTPGAGGDALAFSNRLTDAGHASAAIAPAATDSTGAVFGAEITSAPASFLIGEKTNATVSVKVVNAVSAIAAGRATLTIYASPDASVDSSASPIAALKTSLRLKAGASKTLKLKLRQVPALSAGSYYLIVQLTEPDGSVNDSAASAATPFSLPDVDPSVAFVQGSAALAAGKTSAVAVRVTNVGNSPATGPLDVSLTASDSSTPTPGPVVLAQARPRVHLAAGASTVIKLHFKAPTDLAGADYLVAQIDFTHLPGDVNLANNVAVIPVTIGS